MLDKKLLSPIDNKRDRPLSSYFELPSNKVDNYLQNQQKKFDFDSEIDDEFDSPISKRKSFKDFSALKSNSNTFKNLTNIVNLGKRITKSTKKLITRSKDDENKENDDTASTIIDSDTEDDEKDYNDKLDDTNNTTHDKDILKDLYKYEEDGDDEESDHEHEREGDEENYDQFDSVLKGSKTPLKLRRFHSMYHTNKEKDIILKDNSILKQSNIKTFKLENDLIPRIDEDSLFKLINDGFEHNFKDIVIIDCRFDYEFNGGHIKNAINISKQDELEELFINNVEPETNGKKLLIFHCEFSLFRGPTMAQHLRKCDRILNLNNYPNLNYPDILILQGGYKKFFEKYKIECFPQNYIEMNKKSPELEKYKSLAKSNNYNHLRSNSYTTITSHSENLKILKRQKSITLSLTRASTYCFDDHNDHGESNFLNFDNATSNSNINSYSNLMEEFQPPILNFGLNKSSNSINSLNSSLSELSTFSSNESSDSVSISNSPIMEMNEFFSSSNNSQISTLNTQSNNSSTTLSFNVPKTHSRSNSSSSLKKKKKDFTFPQSSPRRLKSLTINTNNTHSRNNSRTLNHSRNHSRNKSISNGHSQSLSFIHSSPVVSSPLSNMTPLPTPISTLTSVSMNSIDPINDAPVEFLPYDKKF
ncbi:putative M-phase inducer phosphatase [[Candida] jaroonii]|uniref:M-phase inducer phosphatase n=1 Tax=[Candida] jaroonii TaxID=467808 RepID=A0ACA9Y8N3_9ASCO|nr:putative M-phase inducer phosphatase [[Candida] jaroonii]